MERNTRRRKLIIRSKVIASTSGFGCRIN